MDQRIVIGIGAILGCIVAFLAPMPQDDNDRKGSRGSMPSPAVPDKGLPKAFDPKAEEKSQLVDPPAVVQSSEWKELIKVPEEVFSAAIENPLMNEEGLTERAVKALDLSEGQRQVLNKMLYDHVDTLVKAMASQSRVRESGEVDLPPLSDDVLDAQTETLRQTLSSECGAQKGALVVALLRNGLRNIYRGLGKHGMALRRTQDQRFVQFRIVRVGESESNGDQEWAQVYTTLLMKPLFNFAASKLPVR